MICMSPLQALFLEKEGMGPRKFGKTLLLSGVRKKSAKDFC